MHIGLWPETQDNYSLSKNLYKRKKDKASSLISNFPLKIGKGKVSLKKEIYQLKEMAFILL
jgi:hypothetical protein